MKKKHKDGIQKLMNSTLITNWSLALSIVTGLIRKGNAESMIVQYIINNHNRKLTWSDFNEASNWVSDNITNEKLVSHFNKMCHPERVSGIRDQLNRSTPMPHNGNLTLSDVNSWFNSINTARKSKSVTLTCGTLMMKEIDKQLKNIQ